MKKTVSINIKGINFMIEEDAYDLLFGYITKLEKSLGNQADSKEIIEDIELRIAELAQEILADKKDVLELADIEQIITLLGNPEEYIEFSENSNTEEENKQKQARTLYRDLDNAKLAGVCSGLSVYFNIDLIVIRAIFLILLFTGGFGIPLYIILWILLPEANSSIDRLKMKGKPITVENVKEEFTAFGQRLSESGKSFASKINRDQQITKRFQSIGNVIRTFIGIAMLGAGLFFLVLVLILFIGGVQFIPIQGETTNLPLNQIASFILHSNGDIFIFWLAVLLTSVSGIVFFISNGVFLLMKLKSKWTKISSLTLIGLGVLGVSLSFYVGAKTARNFTNEGEIQEEIASLNCSQLEVHTVFKHLPELGNFKQVHSSHSHSSELIIYKNDKLYQGGIKFIYRPSKDSNYHVFQRLSANGFSYSEAIHKAKNIKSSILIDSNSISINPEYSYPSKDKIRAQSVCIIIEIPQNKFIQFENQVIGFDLNSSLTYEKQGFLNHKGEYDSWD